MPPRSPKIDHSVLADLGFSANETRIYLALLKSGPARAGEIIRGSGLQNSVIHFTLGKLRDRGVVSYIRRDQTRLYQAIDPRQLLYLAEKRRQAVEDMLPSLLAVRSKENFPEAEIYDGLNGLKNMCFRLIEDAQPGDEYLFLGFSSSNADYEREVYEFYREFTFVRIERGLKLRGVAHESMRHLFEQHRWPHRNVRFVKFPILKNMSICRDKVIIVPWEGSRVSFLISSAAYANNLRDYFNDLWDSSRGRDKRHYVSVLNQN